MASKFDQEYKGGPSKMRTKGDLDDKIYQPWMPSSGSEVKFTNGTSFINKVLVSSQPDAPKPVFTSGSNGSTKIADPDIIEFDDESVPIEIITDLTFEQVGGQEIINIARNDLINGQNVLYRPIKNLQETYLRYNPKNIVGLQQTSEEIFRNFPIKLANYIPEEGSGPDGSFVYLDAATGNVVVDLVNTRPGEQVDIEVVNQASTFDDTIYVEGNS